MPTGTKVVFNGTGAQLVSFTNPSTTLSHFTDVDVSNASGATFNTTVYVTGQLSMVGSGALSGVNVYYTTQLPITNANYAITNTRVFGNFTMTRDANVQIPLLLVDVGQKLVMNGYNLDLYGNLTVTVSDTAGDGLIMTNAADVVSVTGTSTFTSSGGSATSLGNFTAGELRLAGNFSQTNAAFSTGKAFMPTGTKVVFNGTGAQLVSFTNPSTTLSHFTDVDIYSSANVSFGSSVYIDGRLTISSGGVLGGANVYYTTQLPTTTTDIFGIYNVTNSYASGTMTVNTPVAVPSTTTLIVSGNVTLGAGLTTGNHLTINAGGVLDVYGQSLDVYGNLTVTVSDTAGDGLIMTNAADIVSVTGTSTFTSSGGSATSLGNFTAGELRLAGDFSQTNAAFSTGKGFVSTGTRVVFNGTAAQTVSFSHPSATQSRFADVEVSNTAGVTFASNVAMTGILMAPTGVTGKLSTQGRLLTVPGGLNVDGLILDNVLLSITGGIITKFDNVTFQNYAATSTPLQLNISNTTATFNNLNYSSPLTAGSGYHIGGAGSGNTITVASTNITGTTASSFATVIWPVGTIISTAKGNTSITANTVWTVAGSPYRVQNSVTVGNGGRLQIDAGVVVKFSNNIGLTVSNGGTLDVYGAAGNEAVLTSVNDDVYGAVIPGSTGTPGSAGSGYWKYLYYSAGSAGTMQHVRVLHGGANTGAIYISGASPTLTDIYISDSGTSGLYVYAASNKTASPNIANLSIVNPVTNTVFDWGVVIKAVSTGIVTPVFSGANSISGVLSNREGIYLVGSATGTVNPTISGFTVSDGRYSLKTGADTAGIFTNNVFDGASIAGVYIGAGSSITMNSTNTIQNTPYPYHLAGLAALPAGVAATLAATTDANSMAISGTFAAGTYTLAADPLGTGASQWLQTANIVLSSGTTMNINAGTVFKRKSNNFTVSSGATLNINGVSGNPVTFTSWNDDSIGSAVSGSSGSPARGEGLYLTYQAGSSGVMSFVNNHYASSTTIKASIPMNDYFLNDSQFGLSLTATATSALTQTISNLSIVHTGVGGGTALTINGASGNTSPVFTGVNTVDKYSATHPAVSVTGASANPTFAGFTIDLHGYAQPALLVKSSATGTYSNNVFENAKEGVYVQSGAAPVISNNIMRNSATGVSLGKSNYNSWAPGSVTLANNRIVNNSGRGIYVAGALAGSVIEHNLVRGNGNSGIFVDTLQTSDISIRNNLIAENSATTQAAGVHISAGTAASLLHNTIVGNAASSAGGAGGLFIDANAAVTLTDNILADNLDSASAASDVSVDLAAIVTESYNVARDGGLTGTGDQSADPLFAVNWYLSNTVAGQASSSPAIDVGSDAAANVGMDVYTTSTDGTNDAGLVDIGYHHAAAAPVITGFTTTSAVLTAGAGGQTQLILEPLTAGGPAGPGLTMSAIIFAGSLNGGESIASTKDLGDGSYEVIVNHGSVATQSASIKFAANGVSSSATTVSW